MQWRHAVFISAGNQIRICFEQSLDLFQIAILSCVMNFAAESWTGPKQRDQYDGGSAENIEAPDSAKRRVHIIHVGSGCYSTLRIS